MREDEQQARLVADPELTHLRMENHRLREIVKAADLVHIRLRVGLREACEALDAVDWLTFPDGFARQERAEALIAEWRKLVTP